MLNRATHSVIEQLESRTLLSAGGSLNPAFGNGGILAGYEVLGVRDDGYLIATRPNGTAALLHPDGSFAGNYSGSVSAPAYPPYPSLTPPPFHLPGGKYLQLKNSVLTRYNSNNTVDTTFGNGGSVWDFVSGTTAQKFTAYTVALKGAEIFVVGEATVATGSPNNVFVGIAALNSGGHRVSGFGAGGLAVGSFEESAPYGQINEAEFGPDGALYVSAEQDDDPVVDRFNPATGTETGRFHTFSGSSVPPLLDLAFQKDEKVIIWVHQHDGTLGLYRVNADFSTDTSFGNQGYVEVVPPFGPNGSFVTPGALLIRADGTIFVSGVFDASIAPPNTSSYYTFAYRPGTAPNSGAITGHFFNDLNGNGKRETNEPALRYWAAYADLNHDGIWEQGEPIAYGDYNGYFKIDGLTPGKYVIREIRQAGWTRTTPAGAWPAGAYTVTLAANQLVGYRDFGNKFTG